MIKDEALKPMPGSLTTAELCAQEPIHVPDAIQPHGALLCISELDLQVLNLSANANEMLGMTLSCGSPVDPLLASVVVDWLKGAQVTLQRAIEVPTGRVQVAGHRTRQGLFLEFEAIQDADEQSAGQAYDALRWFMEQAEPLTEVRAVSQLVVEQVRRLTGFNRTLLYRFDNDGNGTVIAEDGDGMLPSYLDLRFPASDIPAQARALYQQNRLRLIPDAAYRPVPINPPVSPLDGQSLDLTPVSLRSVSPVHLQYMRNMATGASMSISLIAEGRLWGLISCHHQMRRWVSPQVRSTCEVLGQLVAQQIVARERMFEISQRMALKRVESALLVHLARAESFQSGLAEHPDAWIELTDATGAAVVFADEVRAVGITPPPQAIKDLAGWLHNSANPPVFVTDALAAHWPPARHFAAEASGLLAVSISQLHPGYIMWFRRELVHTVKWAGDPRKPTDAGTLSPRTSFDQWKELVRNKAAPWQGAQVESATDFRNAIIDFVLRRAEERAAMSEKLQLSNNELEAFSYSVSHDLRAPFRHIVGYAELLRDRESKLDPTSCRFLDTIRDAALSAGRLVDDLLAFSQLNRASLTMGRIDMNKLVAEAKAAVLLDVKGRPIEWRIGPLPDGWGDATMVRQAMLNLLSNAVKYSAGRERPQIFVEGERSHSEMVYYVRDNGIGFDMKYVGKLFGVFQRLHRVEDFEGTGIGLALTKRVIDRHGGWIRAEGVEDQGATFTFSLPHDHRHPESSAA